MACHPPAISETAREVAGAIARGEDPFLAVRGFVDAYGRAGRRERAQPLRLVPPPTGDVRFDAYLAGMAEYFARRDGLAIPAWVDGPERFLLRAWYPEKNEGFWPMALAQSPVAFRRRLVFIDDSEFERV